MGFPFPSSANSLVYGLTPCLQISEGICASLMETSLYRRPACHRITRSRFCSHVIFICSLGCYTLDLLKHIRTDKMKTWSLYELCLQPHPSVQPQCSRDRWSYACRQTADGSHVSNNPNTPVNISDHQQNTVYSCHLSKPNIHHNNTCNHVTTRCSTKCFVQFHQVMYQALFQQATVSLSLSLALD